MMNKMPKLHFLGLMLSFLLYGGLSHAGGGIQLGLSNNYISGAIYSLSSLDGVDLQDNPESGYVHTRFGVHYESDNEALLLDAFGEVGRFILEDQRMGVAIGIRPIAGQTMDKNNDDPNLRDDDFSLLEIAIGVNLSFTSWIAEGAKLDTNVYYYQSPEIVSLGDFTGTKFTGVKVAFPVYASSEIYASYDYLFGNLEDKKGGEEVEILNTFSIGVRIGL